MSEDKTATRIALYMTTIWLVLGELGVFYHFGLKSITMLVVAGVLGFVTAGGIVAIVWTKRLPFKLLAEPLTMFGVVASAVGFFFHPYAWLTIPVGVVAMWALFAMLYDERADRALKATRKAEFEALKLAKQDLAN